MPSAATRLQVEMFGDGETTVVDADGRAHSASVVVVELKDDEKDREPADEASEFCSFLRDELERGAWRCGDAPPDDDADCSG